MNVNFNSSVDQGKSLFFGKSDDGKKTLFKSVVTSITPEPEQTTWDIGIQTTAPDQTFTLQLNGTPNPNINVDWGDGNVETFTIAGNKTNVYINPGNYTVKISGSFIDNANIVLGTNFSERQRVKSTSVIPFISGLTSFLDTFIYSAITSLPTGLFDNNPNIINFGWCFENCASLNSIPSGLFAQNLLVTNFSSCFRNTALSSIPSNLFNNNINVNNFENCFAETTLNTDSYSNLLINMASNAGSRLNNVSFGAGNSKYNLAGQTARQTLESKNWTFSDGGLE
jgi:hypothetical protein